MTEPWERVKMALAEAGRPDMADRIGPPTNPRECGSIVVGATNLTEDEWGLLFKATQVAGVPAPAYCAGCYSAAKSVDGWCTPEPCGHV
ncbi:MAG: hypothetical protein GY701_19520 [Sulfitobacter sp.]|nr:hypothetical protein [Sulfitobacter sp.]